MTIAVPTASPPVPSRANGAWTAADAVGMTLAWQAVTLAGLALLCTAVVHLSVLACALAPLAVAALYARLPLVGTIVLLQTLLYQNWVTSLLCGGMALSDFTAIQGTSFFCTFAAATVSLHRFASARDDGEAARLARVAVIALAAIAAWSGFGLAAGTPVSSVATYFRNAASPLLMLLIGLDVGRAWGLRTPATCLLASLALGLGLVTLEVADPEWYYRAIGAIDYMNLKYQPKENAVWAFYSARDVVEFRTSVLFNVTASASSLASFRFGGPNMHPISYAYVLAIGALVGVALRQWWCVPLGAVLLVMVGVKGALLLLLMSLALYAVRALAGRTAAVAAGAVLACAYVAFGFTFGLAHGDFHVIGFLGGLKGFIAAPQGHGIGVGGNLSATGAVLKITDWEKFQKSGADFAMESAVGALLYQMGVGLLAVLYAFWRTVRAFPSAGPQARDARPADVVGIAAAMCMVNGVFQEEAYAPYGLGLLLLLAGLAIAGRHLAHTEMT